MCLTIVIIETYLNASANFAGFIANKGSVKKATKKQTPAPSKQAPNPNSLQIAKVQKGKKIRTSSSAVVSQEARLERTWNIPLPS